MKANLQTYLRAGDFARVEKSLRALAAVEPDGYEAWGDIASMGAESAKANDERAVKTQCSACHDKYRKRFKAERRQVPLAL